MTAGCLIETKVAVTDAIPPEKRIFGIYCETPGNRVFILDSDGHI